ncbi:MAG: molybdenum cofactor biosynthesis protein MoaE [Verrucomicrobia bacterium]|nr:molybdenum cofactor biosynthesis protein MoaE [Verrucomicrobiota bacterium]
MLKEFWEIVIAETALCPPVPNFSDAAGAVVDFYGVVRGEEAGQPIAAIHYEAYATMARHQLELLASEAAARYPIHSLLLHHRIGRVPAAEPSLFLRVSAAHRGEAFDAAQWIISRLKAVVPIWKHPEAETGAESGLIEIVLAGRA